MSYDGRERVQIWPMEEAERCELANATRRLSRTRPSGGGCGGVQPRGDNNRYGKQASHCPLKGSGGEAERGEADHNMISTIRGEQRPGGLVGASRGDNESEWVGQLALNVDFTPPGRQQQLQLQQQPQLHRPLETRDACPPFEAYGPRGLSGRVADTRQHLIEVSLCVRQQGPPRSNYERDERAERGEREEEVRGLDGRIGGDGRESLYACDNEQPDGASGLGQPVGLEGSERGAPVQADDGGARKRRLYFEPIDKFALEIGPKVGSTRHGSLAFPFRSGSFDACFCFNLLNLRVNCNAARQPVSSNGFNESGSGSREEEEKQWVHFEKLTRELRLSLLLELSRIVDSGGE